MCPGQKAEKVVGALKERYTVGQCMEHPGIRCFFDTKRKLHFELDENMLLVWANGIDRVCRMQHPTSCPKLTDMSVT